MTLTAPRPIGKAPRRARFGRFIHLLARRYMDYERAVEKAAKRKKGHGRRVDVDTQDGWALHWATVGKNKLHDPAGKIKPSAHIASLSVAQVKRLRGPQGQHVHRLSYILRLCNHLKVDAEVELKSVPPEGYLARLMDRPYVKAMDKRGALLVKTLAWMGDPIDRLKPAHDAGFTTVLSFTGFGKRPGISKKRAWPYVDYVRGAGKWRD